MVNRPHFENWVEAIRSRDQRKLNAEIEEGHKSMVLCLLARAAYQVGRHLKFDPKTERVIGDAEADRLLNEPEYRSPYVVPKDV